MSTEAAGGVLDVEAFGGIDPRIAGDAPAEPLFDDTLIEKVRERVLSLPVISHLGMDVAISRSGVVEASLPRIQPYHLGGHDGSSLNGAIIMSLLYCVIVCPGLLHFPNCSTLQFDLRLLKPVRPERVKATGYAYSVTRKLAFCKAYISDADEQPRAVATGITVRV